MSRGRGRPAFVPTDEQRKMVAGMSAVGIPHEDIALVLDIDDKTLRKHFREDLDKAATRANAKVAGSLFTQAIKGNVTAAIFWCKVRLGWREADSRDPQQNATPPDFIVSGPNEAKPNAKADEPTA